MAINKERLIKLTESFLGKRLRTDHSIICAYLTGSMLSEDPFINGTADVDIVMVHNHSPAAVREIVPLSAEVTLDIHHLDQAYFSPSKKVRKDPWVGSSLCFDPVVLYGAGHWFEFAQASVEANFFAPEYVMYRSRLFSNEARTLLSSLGAIAANGTSAYCSAYLKIVENSCNAIACLSKMPLTDRVMMRQFKPLAETVGAADLTADLYDLMLGQTDPSLYYEYFFNSWQYYLTYFGNSPFSNQKMQSSRLPYYTAAVSAYWNEHLISSLWIMAKTWSSVARALQLDGNEYYEALCTMLEIHPRSCPQRSSQLEAFLEKVEEVQAAWGAEQGFDEREQTLL